MTTPTAASDRPDADRPDADRTETGPESGTWTGPKHLRTDPASPPGTTSEGRVIARNFSALLVAQLATWALTLVATIVVPRFLGADLMGRLHLANSLWLIAAVLATFGMDLMLPKAIAREPEDTTRLLGTSLSLRFAFFVPATALLVGYALLAGYPDGTMAVIAILGVAALLGVAASGVMAALQGLETMRPISVATVAGHVVQVGGGVALLVAGFSIYAVAGMIVVGGVLRLVLLGRGLGRVPPRADGRPRRFRPDMASARAMVRTSAPYFGVGVFTVVYREIDAVVISLVVENEAVLGWYSVYDRFAGTLVFVPTVFMTAVYPTLSRRFVGAPQGFSRLVSQTFRWMLLVSVPVGLGIATVARPLFRLLLGDDFTDAAPVMAVGGVVLSLTYLNTVFGMFLISMDRQRLWFRALAIATIASIPIDLVLVPAFESWVDNGAIGGAVAYLLTESFLLITALFLLPRGTLPVSSAWYAVRVIAAGLGMVAAVYPIRELFLPLPVLVGTVVYGALVVLFRCASADERAFLVSTVRAGFERDGTG